MQNVSIKQTAHELLNQLPDNATWDDLMRKVYEHQAIEKGLSDSQADHVKDVNNIRQKYGLS